MSNDLMQVLESICLFRERWRRTTKERTRNANAKEYNAKKLKSVANPPPLQGSQNNLIS